MKVYCFYLVLNSILVDEYPGVKADTIKELPGGLQSSLYAYTNDKDIAKFFKETRDMNKFVEKIIDVDKQDFENFCNTSSCYLLESHPFTIRKLSKDNIYNSAPYHVICTTMEFDAICYCENNIFDDILYNVIGCNIGEFIDTIEFVNQELKDAMKVLCYENFVDYYVPMDIYDQMMGYDNELLLDQFKLYIRLFSNTFKED